MCTVGFGAVAWDVPAWGEVEEQQVSHQGHCQQHGLQFQAYPQEDGARNEAQDAAAGVVLQVGTISCQSPGGMPGRVCCQFPPAEELRGQASVPSLAHCFPFQQISKGTAQHWSESQP